MSRLWAGTSGVRFKVGQDFSLIKNCLQLVQEVIPSWVKRLGRQVDYTLHNLMPRLRMSGAVLLLPLYTFMACADRFLCCKATDILLDLCAKIIEKPHP